MQEPICRILASARSSVRAKPAASGTVPDFNSHFTPSETSLYSLGLPILVRRALDDLETELTLELVAAVLAFGADPPGFSTTIANSAISPSSQRPLSPQDSETYLSNWSAVIHDIQAYFRLPFHSRHFVNFQVASHLVAPASCRSNLASTSLSSPEADSASSSEAAASHLYRLVMVFSQQQGQSWSQLPRYPARSPTIPLHQFSLFQQRSHRPAELMMMALMTSYDIRDLGMFVCVCLVCVCVS